MNNNYGCFLVTILSPAGGVPFVLFVEVDEQSEQATLSAAAARVRKVLERSVHAGDKATTDVAYNTFGE